MATRKPRRTPIEGLKAKDPRTPAERLGEATHTVASALVDLGRRHEWPAGYVVAGCEEFICLSILANMHTPESRLEALADVQLSLQTRLETLTRAAEPPHPEPGTASDARPSDPDGHPGDPA